MWSKACGNEGGLIELTNDISHDLGLEGRFLVIADDHDVSWGRFERRSWDRGLRSMLHSTNKVGADLVRAIV